MLKTYRVVINFCGYYGCEEEYYVDANSPEEAEELAVQEAMDDLCVIECEEEEEEE